MGSTVYQSWQMETPASLKVNGQKLCNLENKEKEREKNNQTSEECKAPLIGKTYIYVYIYISEELNKREKGRKCILRHNCKNFPNVMKDTGLHIQAA